MKCPVRRTKSNWIERRRRKNKVNFDKWFSTFVLLKGGLLFRLGILSRPISCLATNHPLSSEHCCRSHAPRGSFISPYPNCSDLQTHSGKGLLSCRCRYFLFAFLYHPHALLSWCINIHLMPSIYRVSLLRPKCQAGREEVGQASGPEKYQHRWAGCVFPYVHCRHYYIQAQGGGCKSSHPRWSRKFIINNQLRWDPIFLFIV